MAVVLAAGGLSVGFSGWWVCMGHFFFFGGLWVVGSVIRSRHEWWSPAWEASLASLLAWG